MRAALDPGELEEELAAAAAIGDARLPRQAHGEIVPVVFADGSSAGRVRCLRSGFESGGLACCDTLGIARP